MAAPKEGTYLFDEVSAPGKPQDDNTEAKDAKASGEKEKYPYGVFFILGNEFCERFSYYGMRAILVIYLVDWLQLSGSTATAVYHGFVMTCYFMPIFGAILADGYIGKYRTILYLSIIYCIGNIVMAATAVPPPFWVGPMIGLILIGVGTGGIKPCVSAFGGDQFSSNQEEELNKFFSIFYFAINFGSMISTLLTPLLRGVSCIGDSCFPLAFGVPAALMIISLVIFVVGKSKYKLYPPTGNVIGQTFMCIGRAIKNKIKGGMGDRTHWLYYADDKYEANFVEDVRVMLKVLTMFIPLPVFWALFDQQGSRWTLQARLMDGQLGRWHIQPDQMQALNAMLILAFIPLFEWCIYPLCARCNVMQKPLQRMVVGMLFASLAFVVTGFLQIHLDSNGKSQLDNLNKNSEFDFNSTALGKLVPDKYEVLQKTTAFGAPEGMSDVHFINAAPCPVKFNSPIFTSTVPPVTSSSVIQASSSIYEVSIEPDVLNSSCPALSPDTSTSLSIDLESQQGYNVIAYNEGKTLHSLVFNYTTEKHAEGFAIVRIISLSSLQGKANVTLVSVDGGSEYHFNVSAYEGTPYQDLTPGKYELRIDETLGGRLEGTLVTRSGGIYSLILQTDPNDPQKMVVNMQTDVEPNTVSILWQVPQYVIMTTGEVMFSISGLAFAYSQAPTSMKSVLQAGWLITVGMGNLIDVIIAGGSWLSSQVAEFFLFAILMAVTMVIFGVMAYFYQYVKHEREYVEMGGGDKAVLVEEEMPPDTTAPAPATAADSPM